MKTTKNKQENSPIQNGTIVQTSFMTITKTGVIRMKPWKPRHKKKKATE